MKLETRLADWFSSRFPAGFSAVQKRALPHTLRGENTLILAPTGSGKTLAAFLSVLNDLARTRELPNAVRAIYVSPLRSLTRDIDRNLAAPLAAINAEGRIRMEVRTGDTTAAQRAKLARRRPHLLLTTPESLAALLSQAQWKDGFDVRTIIVDEVHSFAENKRGSLLSLVIERLEHRLQRPVQRIGLSATAAPPEAAASLICGAGRPYRLAAVPAHKAHRLEIAPLPEDSVLPAAGFSPYRTAHVAAALLSRAQCSLVFTTTRSAAEQAGLALKILLPERDDDIEVHHASIERARRLEIEEGLADGRWLAVVASSSLELGVDFAAVEQVLLLGCPRGVSRTVQRLGRSGHRVDGVATGWLVPLSLPDLLQCIALREAVKRGRLDPLRPPRAPLDVLAQTLLGLAVEKPWSEDEAFALVRRAGPFAALTRDEFDDVLEYLAGGGRVLGAAQGYGKIVRENGVFRVASQRVARTYFLNIGTISDDYAMKIILGTRRLGTVEESFIGGLQQGEAFVVGGRSVKVKRIQGNTAYVEKAAGEVVKTPRWAGGKMSLTARLATEELELRAALRDHPKRIAPLLEKRYGLERVLAERIADYCRHQLRRAPIPAASPVVIERIHRGRAIQWLFHSVAGRGVNRSLAWVAGHRLGKPEETSVVANFDDHAFLLSFAAKAQPSEAAAREAFAPAGFLADLRRALENTDALGRKFRPIAETAQLLPRRQLATKPGQRPSSWNAMLLYQTLLKYEPGHPLLREAVRDVMEDELESDRAAEEAARLHREPWQIIDVTKPSPFAIPLFATFNREVLLAQNPELAFHDLADSLYE